MFRWCFALVVVWLLADGSFPLALASSVGGRSDSSSRWRPWWAAAAAGSADSFINKLAGSQIWALKAILPLPLYQHGAGEANGVGMQFTAWICGGGCEAFLGAVSSCLAASMLLFCRWSCARSSPPLFAGGGLLIWCFFGLELLPVQGRRSDGGGSGVGGRFSATGAGSRLRVSWPRFVHRFRSRRSTAGGSCSSKASRCSPFLVRGWPAFSSSPGDAGDWEWWRVARMISFLAVVWVVQFRLFWPVCAFVLCVVLLL